MDRIGRPLFTRCPTDGSGQDRPAHKDIHRGSRRPEPQPQAVRPLAQQAPSQGAESQRTEVGQEGLFLPCHAGAGPQGAEPSNAPDRKRPRSDGAPARPAPTERSSAYASTTEAAVHAGLSTPATCRKKMNVSERSVQLASYVLACELIGQPLDDKTLDRLHRINQTGAEVLERLPYGRGNVEADIQRTAHEATYRLLAVREMLIPASLSLKHHDEPAAASMYEAALAQFAGSGACAEISILTAALLARELKEGESLREAATTGDDFDPQGDHAWLELVADTCPGSPLVADNWVEGPPFLAQHGRMSADRSRVETFTSEISHGNAMRAHAVYLASLDMLNKRFPDGVGPFVERDPETRYTDEGLRQATSGLSDGFVGEAMEALRRAVPSELQELAQRVAQRVLGIGRDEAELVAGWLIQGVEALVRSPGEWPPRGLPLAPRAEAPLGLVGSRAVGQSGRVQERPSVPSKAPQGGVRRTLVEHEVQTLGPRD